MEGGSRGENPSHDSPEITILLRRWQSGEPEAFDAVMNWAYQRMLAIATGYMAREGFVTEPASLVHEAYLKLRKINRMEWRDRDHFLGVVVGEMRRVLIDLARIRLAQKRDGGYQRVPLSDDLAWIDVRGAGMLDLDRALDELAGQDQEKVRLLELRYILGCTVPEVSEFSGISEATVDRHLRFARTWLYDRLHSSP